MSDSTPINPFARTQDTPNPESQSHIPPSLPLQDTFSANPSAGTGMVPIALACLIFAYVPIAFYVVLQIPGEQLVILNVFTTAPCIGACFLLFIGLGMRKTPKTIIVNSQGLTIHSRGNKTVSHTWDQVAWLKRESADVAIGPFLNVYNTAGKVILTVPFGFPDADGLAKAIEQYLARKVDPTVTQSVVTKTSRKKAYWQIPSAAFMYFLCVGSAWLSWNLHTTQTEYAAFAVPGVATISETFIAPDGRTTRIRIKMTGENGKVGEDNIEIDPLIWKAMKVGDPFPVTYVPQNPDNIQPVFTGIKPKAPESPWFLGLASVVWFVFALFLTISAVLTYQGYDLVLDSKSPMGFKKVRV